MTHVDAVHMLIDPIVAPLTDLGIIVAFLAVIVVLAVSFGFALVWGAACSARDDVHRILPAEQREDW